MGGFSDCWKNPGRNGGARSDRRLLFRANRNQHRRFLLENAVNVWYGRGWPSRADPGNDLPSNTRWDTLSIID
jgi:hypothetical protein